jgi:hypothetical protein
VLLGQHRPDQPDDRLGVGNTPRLLCLSRGVGDLDGGPVIALQQLVELAGDDALEVPLDLARVLTLAVRRWA